MKITILTINEGNGIGKTTLFKYELIIPIQSKLDNSTLTGRSFHVELASMLSYRMYKLMT